MFHSNLNNRLRMYPSSYIFFFFIEIIQDQVHIHMYKKKCILHLIQVQSKHPNKASLQVPSSRHHLGTRPAGTTRHSQLTDLDTKDKEKMHYIQSRNCFSITVYTLLTSSASIMLFQTPVVKVKGVHVQVYKIKVQINEVVVSLKSQSWTAWIETVVLFPARTRVGL